MGSKSQSAVNPPPENNYDRQRQFNQASVKSERSQGDFVNAIGSNSFQNQNDMPNRMERASNESANPYAVIASIHLRVKASSKVIC